MADWQAIKTEYITTDTSYRKLAQKHGVRYATLQARAKEEKWTELRDRHRTSTVSKTLSKIGTKQADRAARLQTVADKLLTKVEKLVDEGEELLTDTSVMRDIARVLKDIKDIQMIRSDADMREQDARIKKLQKEAMVEKVNNEVRVTIQGELEDYSE